MRSALQWPHSRWPSTHIQIAMEKLVLWGQPAGQLYSKFLLKAEPLAFTFSHDYRGSTSHHLTSRRSVTHCSWSQSQCPAHSGRADRQLETQSSVEPKWIQPGLQCLQHKGQELVLSSVERALADLTTNWTSYCSASCTQQVHQRHRHFTEMRDSVGQPQNSLSCCFYKIW